MGVIALEGMRFFANHGYYEEECILGGEYIIDIEVEVDYGNASRFDQLTGTFNYEIIYQICKMEMKKPSKMLEHLANRILFRLKQHYVGIITATIRVQKLNPPLGGRVRAAIVETSESYGVPCGRCGKGMTCYTDESCWCHQRLAVPPKTLESLSAKYGACICQECLNFYVGNN